MEKCKLVFLCFHTAITHYVYCSGSREIKMGYIVLAIQNCVIISFCASFCDTASTTLKIFLLCCLDHGIVALDLIEYYGFLKATASYCTCCLHLDDLKT